MQPESLLRTRLIGHHGLVASIIDNIKLIKRIDGLIPKKGHPVHITHGQAIAAMIINNLSSDKRQLYTLGQFFEDRPVDLYLGPSVTTKMINYDVLARSLDAITEYGVTDWFLNLAIPILIDAKVPIHDVHIDTTSKSLHGKYKKYCKGDIKITEGLSKDHRSDLKQIIMAMATNGDGIPFWMEPLSGNKNDSETLRNAIIKIENLKKSLAIPHDLIYVADAALYCKEYLLSDQYTNSFNWISRVPESIKLAKDIMRADKTDFEWDKTNDHYKMHSKEVEYCGVKQRWLIVRYNKSHYKEVTTLEKRLDKEEAFLLKQTSLMNNRKYHCEKDALKEIKKLIRNHRHFHFSHDRYPLYEGVGGFTKDGVIKTKYLGWKVRISLSRNKEKIEELKNTKGRFIIATNVLDHTILSNEEVLNYYRKQSKVEEGFKFIKNTSFMMKDVYLKRPDRIGALLAIITLSLMVQSVGQYWLRYQLKKLNLTVPNQRGKPTQSPTLKWIYQTMRTVIEIRMYYKGKVYRQVQNLKEVHKQIISCLGRKAMSIYGFT